jgi:hypothetical protein
MMSDYWPPYVSENLKKYSQVSYRSLNASQHVSIYASWT